MSINEGTINTERWMQSTFSDLAAKGIREQYPNRCSVGVLGTGAFIRTVSLAAFIPALILDLALSSLINLATFFGALKNVDDLERETFVLDSENTGIEELLKERLKLSQDLVESSVLVQKVRELELETLRSDLKRYTDVVEAFKEGVNGIKKAKEKCRKELSDIREKYS